MSKKKKCLPKRDKKGKYIEINGKRIRFLSPDSSFYDTSSTIILRGKPINEKQKKETNLLKFLSMAPISFSDDDDA